MICFKAYILEGKSFYDYSYNIQSYVLDCL